MNTKNSKKSSNPKVNRLNRSPIIRSEVNQLYPDLNELRHDPSMMGYDEDTDDYHEEDVINGEEDSEISDDETRETSQYINQVRPPRLSPAQLLDRTRLAKRSRMLPKSVPKLSRNAAVSNQKSPQQMFQLQTVLCFLTSFGLWKFLLGISTTLPVGYYYGPAILSSKHPEICGALNVSALLSELNDSFKGQDPMSFKVVKNALMRVSEPEPKAPAIIILLASKGAERVSYDFAERLVKAVSPDYLNISGDDYRYLSTDLAKKDIDEKISGNLREDELKAVLVSNLDQMPGRTALMFHTYCDHENAPFKRVVYVMTVASQQVFTKQSVTRSWDEAAQERLETVWNDAHFDQVAALLSRLTVSVAAITANK